MPITKSDYGFWRAVCTSLRPPWGRTSGTQIGRASCRLAGSGFSSMHPCWATAGEAPDCVRQVTGREPVELSKPDPFGRLLVERQLVRPQRETAGLGVRVLAWPFKVRGKRQRRPYCLPEGPPDSRFSSLSGNPV